MRAALVMRLTARDVGQRVSLRRVVGGTPERPEYGDVLGELLAFGPETLTVRRRSGEIVEVGLASVVAGKLVPPAPTRRGRERGGQRDG
jgi:hypothetical protein